MLDYTLIICFVARDTNVAMHFMSNLLITRFIEIFVPFTIFFMIMWTATNIKIHVFSDCSDISFGLSERVTNIFTSKQMKIKLLWKNLTKFIIYRLFWIDCYYNWYTWVKEYLANLLAETCTDKSNFNLRVRWDDLFKLILEKLKLKSFITGLKHKIKLLFVIRNIVFIISSTVTTDMNNFGILAYNLLKLLNSYYLFDDLEFLLGLFQVSDNLLILNLQIKSFRAL